MSGRLQDKVAIVTGAGTGIGEAIAHKFAVEGAKVVLAGLPTDPMDDVTQAITRKGGTAVAFQGDISEEAAAQAAVQAAVDHYGGLNILINNAGVLLATGEVLDCPVEAHDQTARMNNRSVFLMTKFALPYLQKTHGNIVTAGSEAGFNGEPMASVYGGSKGWNHSFMFGVAAEQAPYGVRANCVCPGPTDTAWTHKETGPMDKKMEKQTLQAALLGRRATPGEMTNVYAFLASDEASYVTGALWLADGGTTIAKGPAGDQVGFFQRREPKGDLDLDHGLDGEKNKPVQQA